MAGVDVERRSQLPADAESPAVQWSPRNGRTPPRAGFPDRRQTELDAKRPFIPALQSLPPRSRRGPLTSDWRARFSEAFHSKLKVSRVSKWQDFAPSFNRE